MSHLWQVRDRLLSLSRPLVMGIVNVTPDSFSDGGKFFSTENAVRHALQLLEDGADILDVGGESTRPGAQPVAEAEELDRVLPVIRQLVAVRANRAFLLSIDTYKPGVAAACLNEGADILNDVTGLRQPEMSRVAAAHGAGVILMHMQGDPQTMQLAPHYDDVIAELTTFFQERLQVIADLGIPPNRVVLDPGIGFGKTTEHNLTILARLDQFQKLGRPVCLGVSRKGFMGRLLDRPVERREAGSLAVAADAVMRGAAQILRVHDVAGTADLVKVLTTLQSRRSLAPFGQASGER